MSISVVSGSVNQYPYFEKIKDKGGNYLYYISYKKDKCFHVLEFCDHVKADKCIFFTESPVKMPNGCIIKDITYEKALEFDGIFSSELIERARKNNIEIHICDVISLKITKIRNFIEHT